MGKFSGGPPYRFKREDGSYDRCIGGHDESIKGLLYHLQVDTKRLDESEEAWLYVEIDPHTKHSIYQEFVGRPIVLTWENCD